MGAPGQRVQTPYRHGTLPFISPLLASSRTHPMQSRCSHYLTFCTPENPDQTEHGSESDSEDFHERAAIPHWMVRGIPGNSDARHSCDPDGSQSSEERSQPDVADQRVRCRRCRHSAPVYASRNTIALYSATGVVVGHDCLSRRDLPGAGTGRRSEEHTV